MMATTHALAGLLLGTGVAALVPGLGAAAILAGFAGGFLPDLDLYVAHRKTLHFPVGFVLAAVPATALALVAPGPWTVGLAVFLAAAGLHSASDVLGGGLELRPWEGHSDQAVYSHVHGRWLAPRRYIPYDGAPADLGVAAVLGLGSLAVGDPTLVEPLVAVSLGISMVYTLVRKRLPDIAAALPGLIPTPLRAYVPERYL